MRKCSVVKLILVIFLFALLSACESENSDDLHTDLATETTQSSNNEIGNLTKEYNQKENIVTLQNGLKDDTLIVKNEENNNYSLGINVKSSEGNHILLCMDSDNDIVYYVNFGVDNYIYRIKDGKSELAVAMPAKRLFYVGGKLYFMAETYDHYTFEDFKNGNIFCYDPISGEVSLVVDEEAFVMYVYSDGVYYQVETSVDIIDKTTFIPKRESYFYSFETEQIESISDPYLTLYKWKNYHIAYDTEGIDKDDELYKTYGSDSTLTKNVATKLKTLDGSESVELTGVPVIYNFAFVQEKLYYRDYSQGFAIYDMNTKESHAITLIDSTGYDYTILNNKIYFSGKLMIVDPETGEQSIINPKNETDMFFSVFELYTDEKNLYGVCGSKDIGNGVMKRIVIEEMPKEGIVIKEKDGISYETEHYVYHMYPMGEE